MTSRRSMLLGLVLGAFLSALSLNVAYAQVPRSISYQGLLVKNNLPVNAQVNLHISIYDAANNKLYEESANGVQVTNGLFNVLLGGNSGTLPQTLKFDEQYYLGIDVDNTGELPHTPFVAAPYALNSQTVGGIGVSVTPQAGMLLPLDASGKIPASVLPQSGSSPITSMDGIVLPDGTGNIQLVAGANIQISDNNPTPGHILISSTGGSSPDTIVTGIGLTGGAIGTHFNINIDKTGNWITNGMIGTSVITGRNLDQNIPQNGLYQDALGDLYVGTNATLIYLQPTNPFAPTKNNGGIGLNLANPNTWTGLQTFAGGFAGSFGSVGTLGVNANAFTVNGLAEPLAAPNTAVYELTDNGDLKVTGSSYLVGNTYIGAATNGGTNTMGTAGQSANTVTGATNAITGTTSNTITGGTNAISGTTNTITGTTSNSIQSPSNLIGTANSASTNTIGNAGTSTNTVTGANNTVTATSANTITAGTTNTITAGTSNTLTATTSNNVQAPSNNIGTTTAASVNNIGNAGTSTNNVTGATNNVTGTTANNVQAPTNNIGTSQVVGGINNVGTPGASTNNISGATNNSQANTINIGTTVANANTTIGNTANNTNTTINGLTASVNATTNNIGTQATAVTNNIGTGGTSANNIGTATSTNTINGTTTFNGVHIVNGNSTFAGNITQTAPGTTATFLNTNTGNLTVTGTLTQSGGNATINGGATNVFGTVGGSSNTIGAAGSTNSMNGLTNTFTATAVAPNGNNFVGNINQTLGSTTLLNTQVNGTLGSTGNLNLGTVSTNNNIGAAGAINTLTGATNNINSTTATNFTGNIVQISGSAALAPTAGTTNSFGTGINQTNNISTGNGTTTTIGNGSGNVNNIGTSVAGTSTNNIGNLNTGTTNNINGLSTFGYTGDQTYVRIAGGAASCGGIFPTAAQSELLVNGDGWFDGTLAACRINIFGGGASCIANLNTTNFGSCAGGVTPINLISGLLGVGTVNITNIQNIQATNDIQTNLTLTIGVPGTNATNITSSNAGPGSIAQQTPSVAGRIPTFQQYMLALVPASGPNGGGSVTFNAGNTGGALNFDALSGMSVAYRTHNVGIPVGELWITQTLTDVTVESSAAGDNNMVQLVILRP